MDLQKFEDYLKHFIPFIKDHTSYAYVVEKDKTPDRHIHALVGSDSYDGGIQKYHTSYRGKKRGLKEFQDMIQKGSNTNSHGWDTKFLPDTQIDLSKTLGYIHKDVCSRRETTFSTQQITDSIEQYHAWRRLDAIVPVENDFILLTKKNGHAHISNFIKTHGHKYNVTLEHPEYLAVALAKEGYTLVDLSDKTFEHIVADLRVRAGIHECSVHFLSMNYPTNTQYEDNHLCTQCGKSAHKSPFCPNVPKNILPLVSD